MLFGIQNYCFCADCTIIIYRKMAWCGIIGHKCQLFAPFVAYIEPPECLSPTVWVCRYVSFYGMAGAVLWPVEWHFCGFGITFAL